MRFLDRFRKKSRGPSATREIIRQKPGPLTAREAWNLVGPRVAERDPAARLTLLSSGLDLNAEGRSFTWEFGFDLPGRGLHGLFTLEPSGEGPGIDADPIVLVARLGPPLSGEGRPSLPETFRDSPDAVSDFIAQGVDFVAGPSDMKLEARLLASGEAVWLTYDWDAERRTAFAAQE